jgi:hypothetical protein
MISKKKHNFLIIIVSLFSLQSAAQFHYRALPDSVKETGFYSIAVTPELSSYLKPDLSDLRIIDEKKQWVPFIIDYPYLKSPPEFFLFHNMTFQKTNSESKTILIIENSTKKELTNFIVELKNAAAQRTGSLSGSDNNKNWFVILDSLVLHESSGSGSTTHEQRINFPASAYKYFKLTINNDKKEALNILKAMSSRLAWGDSIKPIFKNPEPFFSQKNDGKYSVITIAFSRPYQISEIQIHFSSSQLYKRNAKMFAAINENLATTWHSNSFSEMLISSDNFSGYSFPTIKTDTLYLLIENGDNPPLKIFSISTGVINRNIIAQLEKNKTYTLLLDNPQATAPVYDLQNFKDRITSPSVLAIKEISKLDQPKMAPAKKQISRQWIWPVIILVTALLGFLTWKLTSDMKKNSVK